MKYTMNKIFLDSNILVYLYTADEIEKIKKIRALLEQHEHILISTQVLFEFSYVMHRKLKFDYGDIEKALREFHTAFDVMLITYDTLLYALKIASKHKYSFPDSLIVATALEAECDILLSIKKSSENAAHTCIGRTERQPHAITKYAYFIV
jgi:predicted nucleic acid-binding protein